MRSMLTGAAYKPDVHDTRESPSPRIMEDLLQRGGDVRYCDPFVDRLPLADGEHRAAPWTEEKVEAADCVVMLTAHRTFLEQPLWKQASLVVDTHHDQMTEEKVAV